MSWWVERHGHRVFGQACFRREYTLDHILTLRALIVRGGGGGITIGSPTSESPIASVSCTTEGISDKGASAEIAGD